jgi:nitroreductase
VNTSRKDTLNFILGRRSIRAYTPGTVTDEDVRLMLEAAMAAPSAVARDPWRFVVVRDKRKRQLLAEELPNGQMLPEAALGIVVCGDLEQAHDKQLSYLLQDCAAAIENLLVAAHALGHGACWLGVHPRENRIRHVTKVLGLPSSVIPVAILAIGRPGERKEARTRFNPAFVHKEHW